MDSWTYFGLETSMINKIERPDKQEFMIDTLRQYKDNWLMLEQLPDGHGLIFDKMDHRSDIDWEVIKIDKGGNFHMLADGKTPAEALRKYYENKI